MIIYTNMNPESKDQVCVLLWALPRSLSTAMTKCMSFVDGVQIWHEPYMYSFHNEKFQDPVILAKLRERKVESILKSMEKLQPLVDATPRGRRIDNELFEFPWVKTQLETQDPDKKLIFVKDMAHVLHKKYEYLPTARKYRHTFLIRDPRRMYPSFRRMMIVICPEDKKASFDIIKDVPFYEADKLYQYTYDLWKYTKENIDPDALILDGTELAAHPEKILPKYFEALRIPYKEDYLKWDPSPDIITQWKASFQQLALAHISNVLKSAVESSHFIAEADEPPSRDTMTPDIIRCIDAALPYYNEMYELRIKP